MHCCDWRSVVVCTFTFQPSQTGLIHAWVMYAQNGSLRSIDVVLPNGEENAQGLLFFAWKRYIAIKVLAAMPAWGIAITWQQLFRLRKRRTITLDRGCLHDFCMTSFSSKIFGRLSLWIPSWSGSNLHCTEHHKNVAPISAESTNITKARRSNQANSATVVVITFYSPSWLGQETAKGPFGLRAQLPPAHLSTT